MAMLFMVIFAIAVTVYWPSPKDEGDKPGKTTASTEPVTQNAPLVDVSSSGNVENPYLLEQLPWNEADVESIVVKWDGQEYNLSSSDVQTLLNSLRWIDTMAAKSKATPSSQPATIQIQLQQDQSFDLPYNVEINAYEVNDTWYHASDQALLLMERLLRHDDRLALFDELSLQAKQEEEKSLRAETEGEHAEDVNIDGLDYSGWEQKLATEQSLWKIPFYDNDTGKIYEAIKSNDDVVKLYGQIIFTSDAHQSKDGVKVGLTKDQVDRILGSGVSKLPSKWSYKVGDYYRFHIYFKNDRAEFLVLSAPLS